VSPARQPPQPRVALPALRPAQATTTSSAASTAAAQATTTSSAASTAAAAAQASSTAAASIKPGTSGTLTWTVSFDPPNNQPQYDAFVAPWNQANPQAKVEAYNVSGGTVAVNEKILTLAAAGTPFDVIGYITFIQSLAKPGVVQPLEPFMSRDKYDISGYNPNTLKTFGSYGGKQIFAALGPWRQRGRLYLQSQQGRRGGSRPALAGLGRTRSPGISTATMPRS